MRVNCKAAISMDDGIFTKESFLVEKPQKDEGLGAVKAAGQCHTDYNSINWLKPKVMGHESSRIVRDKGKDVTHLNIGDLVILNCATPVTAVFQYHEKYKAVSGNFSITEISQTHLFVEEQEQLFEQQSNVENSIIKMILMHKNSLPPIRFDCGKDDFLIDLNEPYIRN